MRFSAYERRERTAVNGRVPDSDSTGRPKHGRIDGRNERWGVWVCSTRRRGGAPGQQSTGPEMQSTTGLFPQYQLRPESSARSYVAASSKAPVPASSTVSGVDAVRAYCHRQVDGDGADGLIGEGRDTRHGESNLLCSARDMTEMQVK